MHTPLRERFEDVPLLVEPILSRLATRLNRRIRGVEPEAMKLLIAAPWRGNVRELENVLERAMILTEGERLGVADLPAGLTSKLDGAGPSSDLRTAVRTFELEHIRRVLVQTNGNREQAARLLGIDPSLSTGGSKSSRPSGHSSARRSCRAARQKTQILLFSQERIMTAGPLAS